MGESLLNRVSGSSVYHSDLQQSVDGLVGGFVRQATDWRSLASVTVGSLAYRTGRLGVMDLGKGPLLRAVSLGLGLTAEVSAFELSNRTLQSVGAENRYLWRWSGSGGIRQGLLQSFVTFGALKGAGRFAQGENLIAQHLLQDSAMVLGHQVTGALGIAPRPAGTLAEQFLHAEATNLQVGAGMALVHGGAPGMAALERGMDLPALPEGKGNLILFGISRLEGSPAFAVATPSGGRMKAAPDPKESTSLLMTQKGEGNGTGGPSDPKAPDLKALKKSAKKNSAEAYETLENLARGGNYEALCVLAELARSRVAAIFSLIKMAEGGDLHAWTKLKALNPVGLVARPGWRDPAQGRKGDAFLYLAGIGNQHALEILVRDSTWYMDRGSLDLLMSLAELGHFDAIRGISEAAFRNPRAVELLARLADSDKGISSPRYYLRELDPGHYVSTLRMEHLEMVKPLATLARFGNEAAFTALSELASRYEAAAKALAGLALEGNDRALTELGKVLKSPNAGPAREAAIALYAMAEAGSKKAWDLLPPPTLVRMVDLPPRTIFGRFWRLYSRYVDKLWTLR